MMMQGLGPGLLGLGLPNLAWETPGDLEVESGEGGFGEGRELSRLE